MKLVVDTNVLMSAMIADSTTRMLLRTVDDELATPAGVAVELDRYENLLQEKSGLADSELGILRNELFARLELVPDETLDARRDEAANELAEVDPDDVIFLAAALAVDGAIWSDDSHSQEQDLVPVLTTGDVLEELSVDG